MKDIVDNAPKELLAHMGHTDEMYLITNQTAAKEIVKAYAHELYDPEKSFVSSDIALLRLKNPVKVKLIGIPWRRVAPGFSYELKILR